MFLLGSKGGGQNARNKFYFLYEIFWTFCSLLFFCLLSVAHAAESNFDYALSAVQIAKYTYFIEGKTENFSTQNGGNIVNTAFIITSEGVIVIDTGVSSRYGKQQRAVIARVTDKPVIRVYITHHHPDHFLGNQAYKDAKIYALAGTTSSIKVEGENFTSNMYRLVGDWMRNTVPTIPNVVVKPGIVEIGGHKLEFLALDGHTGSDLVIFDHTTAVLFTGDLVFNNRALATSHAKVIHWFKALDRLKKIPFKIMVPGHGSPAKDSTAIDQTRDYLTWLVETLKKAAATGMDMNEVMRVDIPARFQSISLVQDEMERSVSHLYPAFEREALIPVNQ